MFDLVLISDDVNVPVPLPGRAIVFCDGTGTLRTRLPSGEVKGLGPAGVPGETGAAGVVAVEPLAVGSIAFLSGVLLPVTVGADVIVSNANRVQYVESVSLQSAKYVSGLMSLPLGQVWRVVAVMGGASAPVVLAIRLN